MNRPLPGCALLACAFLALASAAVYAQQPSPATQSGPYSGTAAPPPDDTIESSEPQEQPQPLPKPNPGKAMNPSPAPTSPRTNAVNPPTNYDPNSGTDEGIIPPAAPVQPSLSSRAYSTDPDGDIVHPEPLPPGVLGEGSTIRVRLLDELSTRDSQKGDPFRSRVAS